MKKNITINSLGALGVFSFLFALLHFFLQTADRLASTLLALFFVAILAIAGRWSIWRQLFFKSHSTSLSTTMRWQTASLVAIIIFSLLGILFRNLHFFSFITGFSSLLLVVYSVAKIRCWQKNCCGWSKMFPIQILESLFNLIIAFLLYYFVMIKRYEYALISFGVLYSAGRFLFIYLRTENISRQFASIQLCIGLYFLLLAVIYTF